MIAWAVLSVIGVVIAMQVQMPPGNQSRQGAEESSIIQLMLILATPVFVGVVLFLLYSAFAFRRPPGATVEDGPPMRGYLPLQVTWIAATAVVVFILAGFGIVELSAAGDATNFNTPAYQSLGEPGVQPVGHTEKDEVQVQVIGQQWYFTYRYPQYGIETTHLILPVDANIDMHITSTDAIHSFWAYELGIKADANPGVDNEAFVTTMHTGTFTVRCAELCGLWHGNMYDTGGRVVSQGEFASWIKDQQSAETDLKLPPYAPYYFPSPRVKGS